MQGFLIYFLRRDEKRKISSNKNINNIVDSKFIFFSLYKNLIFNPIFITKYPIIINYEY